MRTVIMVSGDRTFILNLGSKNNDTKNSFDSRDL